MWDWYYGLAWRSAASSSRDDECRTRLDRVADLLQKNDRGKNERLVAVSLENLGFTATCPNGCLYEIVDTLFDNKRLPAIVCTCNHHEHQRGWNLRYDRVKFVKVIGEKGIRELAIDE